jgi:hypothetical protein
MGRCDAGADAAKSAMWKDVVNPFYGLPSRGKEEVNFEEYQWLEKFGSRLNGVAQIERHTGRHNPPPDHPI